MAYEINQDECQGCGTCQWACSAGAIYPDGWQWQIDYNKCIDCGNCIHVCPVQAIHKALP